MKKKVLAITMAALMAASLTACGGSAKRQRQPIQQQPQQQRRRQRIPRQPRVRMRPAQRQLRLGLLRMRQAAGLSWRPTQSSLLTSIMTEMPS